MTRKNIVLVGFMGTGKTTVGTLLAGKLAMKLVDMDAVIEERAGKKISAIFEEDGESHFRKLERDLVVELSAATGLVVAAGGGVVLNRDNIADFSRTGTLVCLTAEPATILERVSKATHRPLLEGGEKAEKTLRLLESRREIYGSIPNRIDTTSLTPGQVAEEIVALAGEDQGGDGCSAGRCVCRRQ